MRRRFVRKGYTPAPFVPQACPPEEEISNAVRVLENQKLHVYQVLYNARLTNSGDLPIKVSRSDQSYGNLGWVKLTADESRGLSFHCRGTEPDAVILEKANLMLTGKGKEKPDARACCPLAEQRYCVCLISFSCPLHGCTCVGTHD